MENIRTMEVHAEWKNSWVMHNRLA